ncbi:hypothetical protein BT63DRAFT_55500 [Microthyrium microscopicum]|uniref:F-box domain-containing protein n=1 Tax=Microthyrium microscopicum TaxID=703497 RepID=A0A6A6U4C7_9PEZI|nr:hypothetical protein BT63DRAFT_55500 [Microthyrium microscopicum]
MGYSEVRCQLCGVGFNIGRVRRAGEPLNTAFSFAEQKLHLEHNFVNKSINKREYCPENSLCINVKANRRKEQSSTRPNAWLLSTEDDDDPDWEYQSQGDSEPLEYAEEEDPSDGSNSEAEGDTVSESCDIDSRSTEISIRPSQRSNSPTLVELMEDLENEESPSEEEDDNFEARYNRSRTLEHLAGPLCNHPRGYNGNNISAEEMFGCCTSQCLVPKDGFWKPHPTDEDFELSSKYFLSGLGGHMNSRDYGGVRPLPSRHGLGDEIHPDDQIWQAGEEVPLPFHPACLEIYRRVSQIRFGEFNVDGLCQWRLLECGHANEVYNAISHSHPVLRRALSQEWHHRIGDEWLAANPLLIPSLHSTLEEATYESSDTFNPCDSAFSSCREGVEPKSQATGHGDCFQGLPQEANLLIVEMLLSSDIAALRLVSRAFTHLPICLWKKLLKKEMPWLWEMRDYSPPYKWSAIAYSELKEDEERIKKAAEELRHLQHVYRQVFEEEMPEHWEQYCMDHPWLTDDVDAEERVANEQSITRLGSSRSLFSLPQNRTNWYEVYTLIKRNWDDLKGLRNRERIWTVCETICDGIEKLTEKGKIIHHEI